LLLCVTEALAHKCRNLSLWQDMGRGELTTALGEAAARLLQRTRNR
jgi:hypothetical protein